MKAFLVPTRPYLTKKDDLKGALAEYEAELNENPQEDDVMERQLAVRARLRQSGAQ